MKKCFKCGHEKEIDEFYRHPRMSDGHIGKCKDCARADGKANRDADPEKYRRYDRYRYRRDYEKRREVCGSSSKNNPLATLEHKRKWRDRNRDKIAAHTAVGNAIRDGRLVPLPCERCGTTAFIHAHHEDYSRPLDVTWLCSKCHGLRHAEINEERRNNLTVSPD